MIAKKSQQVPAIWNQHLATRRTNNDVEAWHSTISSSIPRSHSSMNTMIPFLQKENSLTTNKFEILKKQVVEKHKTSVKQDLNDFNISIIHIELI